MKRSLRLRILDELVAAPKGTIGYHALMYKLWPPEEHPRAYRHSHNGGPPGVAMVFGRALSDLHREGSISRFLLREERYGQSDIWITSSGKKLAKQ